jgi:hypothetical protein
LEKVLRVVRPTAEDLNTVRIDSNLSYEMHLRQVIRRESLIGWSFLWQFAGRKAMNLQFTEAQSSWPEAPPILQSLYRVFVLSDEIAAMKSIYNRMEQVASQPYYKAAGEWDKLNESARAETFYPCSMMLPMLMPAEKAAHRAAARSDAMHNAAVLALAICRYQIKNLRLPEKLNELVPNFCYAVPTDPFDGKPMRYKRTEKGAVIYSIGIDMVDDGGKALDDKTQEGDITFELEQKPLTIQAGHE